MQIPGARHIVAENDPELDIGPVARARRSNDAAKRKAFIGGVLHNIDSQIACAMAEGDVASARRWRAQRDAIVAADAAGRPALDVVRAGLTRRAK